MNDWLQQQLVFWSWSASYESQRPFRFLWFGSSKLSEVLRPLEAAPSWKDPSVCPGSSHTSTIILGISSYFEVVPHCADTWQRSPRTASASTVWPWAPLIVYFTRLFWKCGRNTRTPTPVQSIPTRYHTRSAPDRSLSKWLRKFWNYLLSLIFPFQKFSYSMI